MPLYPDTESVPLGLDGLDDPVLAARAAAQAAARRRDGLVVKAVDRLVAAAERGGHARTRLDDERVAALRFGQLVGTGGGQVLREVVVERSAVMEREQLHPVADAEHGARALERGGEQAPVEVDLRRGCGVEEDVVGVGTFGKEVVTPRNQQAIDPRHERVDVLLHGQVERKAACLFDRARVGEVRVQVVAIRPPAAAVVQTLRDSDRGSHDVGSIGGGCRKATRCAMLAAVARMLIAGCGYVGAALAQMWVADGHEVFGLKRDPDALPIGVHGIAADLRRPESLGALPERIDVAVYAAGSKSHDSDAYRAIYLDGLGNLLRVLREQGERPRRVLFTSSTAVYGQRRGEWVDETSPTRPDRFSGEIMLLAERLLLASSFPATVLRLGGIYGPGRTRLVERVRAGEAVVRGGPPHYTNRIHRDDAAAAMHHLLQHPEPLPLYLGVDDEPADEGAVLAWLAEQAGAPAPRTLESAGHPGSERRRAGSKRCRNARLRCSGYVFRFPTFREGYGALLASPRSA